MTNRKQTYFRTAAALAACAGMVIIASTMEPRGADAGPARSFYGDGYQQHVGREVIPVTMRRYEFTNAADNGHADFGKAPDAGGGRYAKIASDALDADRRPAFQSTGYKVLREATDSAGNGLAPSNSNIDSEPGDVPAQLDAEPGGAVTSAQTFGQWFEPTPGVNRWSKSTVDFHMDDSGAYVLEGSLDDLGSQTTDYTTELEWGFVHEAERDNFLEIETDAEAWVYIDGRLVIDGGGLSEEITFDIVNSEVIPGVPYSAEVTVVGAAIQNSSYHYPVTMRAMIGSASYEPFGPYSNAVTGNVNDNQSATGNRNFGANPRTFQLPDVHEAGTPINILGRSWTKKRSRYSGDNSSHWQVNRGYSTADDTPQIKVLRDGDRVPNIQGAYNQGDVASFLSDYVDPSDSTIVLDANQAIYLFELGTSHTSSSADFQDLVVVVTLSGVTDDETVTTTTTETQLNAAPRLGQRIDLSRLDWLEDRKPYKVQVFYANRTGAQSDIRIETNLRTMNVIAQPLANALD
jgi:hypothetical protein